MGTTANGLPYPESTDPVADGAAAIQALAEALDPSVWLDTGDLPCSGAFTGSFRAVRAGIGIVLISGEAVHSTLANQTWTDTGVVLPAGFRPASTKNFSVSVAWDGVNTFGYRLATTGVLQCRRATASNAPMALDAPYFVTAT